MSSLSLADPERANPAARNALATLDWEHTAVGPPQRWPAAYRTALHACLESTFPTLLALGPRLELVYNDTWTSVCSWLGPRELGRPLFTVWQAGTAAHLRALLRHVHRSEQPVLLPCYALENPGAQPLQLMLSLYPLRAAEATSHGVFAAAVRMPAPEHELQRLLALHELSVHAARRARERAAHGSA